MLKFFESWPTERLLTLYPRLEGETEQKYRYRILSKAVEDGVIKSTAFRLPNFKKYYLMPSSGDIKGTHLSEIYKSLYFDLKNPQNSEFIKEYNNYLDSKPVTFVLDVIPDPYRNDYFARRWWEHQDGYIHLIEDLFAAGDSDVLPDLLYRMLVHYYTPSDNEAFQNVWVAAEKLSNFDWVNLLLKLGNEDYIKYALEKDLVTYKQFLEEATLSNKLDEAAELLVKAGKGIMALEFLDREVRTVSKGILVSSIIRALENDGWSRERIKSMLQPGSATNRWLEDISSKNL